MTTSNPAMAALWSTERSLAWSIRGVVHPPELMTPERVDVDPLNPDGRVADELA
jgi:hypothetical protein